MFWTPLPPEHIKTLKRRLEYLNSLVDKEQVNSYDLSEIGAIQAVVGYSGYIKSRHLKTLRRRKSYLQNLKESGTANAYDVNEFKALEEIVRVVELNASGEKNA